MPRMTKQTPGSTTGREPRPARHHRKWSHSLIYGAGGYIAGADLLAARTTLGRMWGLGRKLSQREMAAVLLVDPNAIMNWEKTPEKPIPRHVSIIVTMCLDGARPRALEAELVL